MHPVVLTTALLVYLPTPPSSQASCERGPGAGSGGLILRFVVVNVSLLGRWPVAICVAVAAALLVGGCGGSDSPDTGMATHPSYGHATAGGLRLTHGYVPEPASPAVAAAYFTVRNTGSSADTLTKVSTPAAAEAGLHRYAKSSGGAERMVPLRGGLRIPAHGTVTLHPGGIHVMLMEPGHALHKGRQVKLRLTFRHAGRVTLPVPVVATSDAPQPMHSGMNMS